MQHDDLSVAYLNFPMYHKYYCELKWRQINEVIARVTHTHNCLHKNTGCPISIGFFKQHISTNKTEYIT